MGEHSEKITADVVFDYNIHHDMHRSVVCCFGFNYENIKTSAAAKHRGGGTKEANYCTAKRGSGISHNAKKVVG